MSIPSSLAYSLAVIFLVLCPSIVYCFIKNERILKNIVRVALIVYIVCTLTLVWCETSLGQTTTTVSVNFSNSWFSSTPKLFSNSLRDYVLNLAMFIPFGFAIAILSNATRDKYLNALLYGLILSIVIEVGQWILPIYRSPELGDIILNTLSSLIGVLYFFTLKTIKTKLVNKSTK